MISLPKRIFSAWQNTKIRSAKACNAKYALADVILPILLSYRRLLVSEQNYSIPDWVVENDEALDIDSMNARWLAYVNDMIFAFETVQQGTLTMTNNEIERQQNGLNLFAKYYLHLWD